MSSAAFFLSLLLLMTSAICPLSSQAATPQKGLSEIAKQRAGTDSAPLVQATETGLFKVSLVVRGGDLVTGANDLDLVIRDRQGRKVDGAEVAVTPWMTKGGQGVWEKPEVTGRGDGNYHVENVAIAGSGLWDIRVAVRKGRDKGTAVFSFTVGSASGATRQAAAKFTPRYPRTLEYYKVPNVTLLNQDGKPIRLRSFLDSGKPVIIDFIYTTCTTVCPILSAGFSNLRDELGKDARSVQLVSISIDPEHDRPEQMKQYLSRYNAGEGWDFLTGSREDIALVLKALDATIVDKMSHFPLYILHGPRSDEWVRIRGLIGQADLMNELRRIRNR
jgi:protein SCO1/2